mmetsp:Transcript_51311/g.128877  ORF Transcript_51311/g.128877 Transcript_51311/m.128877 type:complete len:128 (+) Transcript_51311:483-866(+)
MLSGRLIYEGAHSPRRVHRAQVPIVACRQEGRLSAQRHVIERTASEQMARPHHSGGHMMASDGVTIGQCQSGRPLEAAGLPADRGRLPSESESESEVCIRRTGQRTTTGPTTGLRSAHRGIHVRAAT